MLVLLLIPSCSATTGWVVEISISVKTLADRVIAVLRENQMIERVDGGDNNGDSGDAFIMPVVSWIALKHCYSIANITLVE